MDLQPAATSQQADQTVRLLTYNIFMRPPGIHSGAGDWKTERMHQFASTQLAHFDVVALQECFAFGSSRRTELVRLAAAAGLAHHAACPVPGWVSGRVDGGLLVLSRFPIAASEFVAYPRGVHSDWLAAKGVLYAKIELPSGRHLMLFTTHTQASYEAVPPLDSPATKVRLAQLQSAGAFVQRVLASDPHASTSAVVLVGDLNVDGRAPHDHDTGVSHSAEYAAMMQAIAAGLQSGSATGAAQVVDVAYDALGCHPVTTNTIVPNPPGEPENKSLDYVLLIRHEGGPAGASLRDVATEAFAVDGRPYTHLSDHCGLRATLAWQ
ncbi:Endonuclease/exonuclease/phosphatase [Entophlyctis helioformis]|nr:Endonuclease/exonuclease/phosphatase [Entophlyctis helioformis]